MKKHKLISSLFSLVVMMFCITSSAINVDSASAPITLGRWHSSLSKAEAYSRQHDIPMLFIWGSIGCSYCDKIEGYVETETFKTWMAQRKLVMVYLKQDSRLGPPEMDYGHDGINGKIWEFPFVSVYWHSKDARVFNFVGRFYNQDSTANAQTLISRVESYIGEYAVQSQCVTIGGSEAVFDNVNEQYSALYRDASGNEQDVSGSVTWSVSDLSVGSISATGLFTPVDIVGSKDVLVRAAYQIGGEDFAGEKRVTVSDSNIPVGSPLAAAIGAPAQIQSGTTAQLKAMFNYENGPFEAGAENTFLWQVTEGPASINSAGLLTADTVLSDTTATVRLRITTPRRVVFAATYVIAVTVNPATEQYTLEIMGLESVDEGSITQYTAVLKATGLADQDVTATATWNVTGPAGTAVTAGKLTAGQVAADSSCTLTASHSGASASKTVNIRNVALPKQLLALEIQGPQNLDEGSSADYTCIAHFADESWEDVTQTASWSVDNTAAANVDASGHFTSLSVVEDTDVVLTVSYGGKSLTKIVRVINTNAPAAQPVGNPISAAIHGPTQIQGDTTAQLKAMFNYENGAFEAGAENTFLWQVTEGPASINAAGLLTADTVLSDTTATVRLRITTPRRVVFNATYVIAINFTLPKQTIALEMRGQQSLNEGSSADYTCIAYFADESWENVTQTAGWSVANTTAANVDASGHFTSLSVVEDTDVVLTVTYGGKTTDKVVRVINTGTSTAVQPVGILISGTQIVYGGDVAQYQCELVFSDNSRQDVTRQSQWIGQSPFVRVAAPGLLRTTNVGQDKEANLLVRYITSAGVFYTSNYPITVTADEIPVEPPQRSISIVGIGEVKESTVTQYKAILSEEGSPTTEDVTESAAWSVDPSDVAAIGGNSGLLTAGQVESAVVVTVQVVYSLGDQQYSQVKEVTIEPVARSLSVSGNATLTAGAEAQYQATLTEEGSADLDVTQGAQWSIGNSAAALISQSGVLTAKSVDTLTSVAVTAQFTIGVKSYSNTVTVEISPVLMPVGPATGVIIVGPDVVESGSSGQYVCYLTYANGAKAPGTPGRAVWSAMTAGTTISSAGVLTADEATEGFQALIRVRYDRLSTTHNVYISTRGKFAIAGVNDPLQPVENGKTLTFREGDQVSVAVERYQGLYEAATASFVVTPADLGITLGSLVWNDGEDGVKHAPFQIPAYAGVQPKYSVEIQLTSSDLEVNPGANRFVVEVLDEAYGSSVEDYLFGYQRIPFVTSDDEWFYPLAALDGAINLLRSMSPAQAGESYTLEASVTGPGIFTFNAGISNQGMTAAGGGDFTVTVADDLYQVTPTGNVDDLMAVVVPEGAQVVTFNFKGDASTQAGDFAWIMDMDYTRLEIATLLAPGNGSTILAGDKKLVWSNVLGSLASASSIDAHYKIYVGDAPGNLQYLDTVTDFDNTERVAYELPLTEGTYYWQVLVVVEASPTQRFDFASDISVFTVLDADGPQFEISEQDFTGLKWLKDMALDGSSFDLSLIAGFAVNVGPIGYTFDPRAAGVVVEVMEGSLPKGMEININTEVAEIYLSGTPTTIGVGTAVLQIFMDVGGTHVPGTTLVINYDVIPFPQKLKGTYNGFVWMDVEYNCDADDMCQSTELPVPAVVTVSANGLVNINFSMPNSTGTYITYSADMGGFDADAYYRLGAFENSFERVISEDESIDYTISIDWDFDVDNKFLGTPAMSVEMMHWFMVYDKEWEDWFPNAISVVGDVYANIWDDGNAGKDSQDIQVLEQIRGYYTVSLEDDNFLQSNHDSYGNGYLTMTVNQQGTAAISGKLADGQSVSASSKVFVLPQDEDSLAFVEFKNTPSGYQSKGGFVYMKLYFKDVDGIMIVEVRDSVWVNMDPQANGFFNDGFQRAFDGECGGKYTEPADIRDLFWSPAFFARYPVYESTLIDVGVAANGRSFTTDAQSGLSISVDLKTGIIGVSASGRIGAGVLTPFFTSVEGKEDVSARAYVIGTASNYRVFDDEPSYQYQKSTAWQLESDCGCH